MVDGLDCGLLIWGFVRAVGFLGVCVGLSGVFYGMQGSFSLFSTFFWKFSLMCSGGLGALSHGVGSGTSFHG